MIRVSVAFAALITILGCHTSSAPSAARPEGASTTAKTKTLEAGAKILQTKSPLDKFDIYLVGFHPMKDNPAIQMEAHHYCKQVNEDFAQCILFDGDTENANLNGIEYIISEKLFNTLPAGERKFWHPHNYEILSGELIAPGIPQITENQLMKRKMNSYGKTWHVWMTDSHGKPVDALPLGAPHLAWSFNRDGEADASLISRRDRKMHLDTGKERNDRQDMVPLAHPQSGVDDLRGKFPGPTHSIPGVVDAREAQGSASIQP